MSQLNPIAARTPDTYLTVNLTVTFYAHLSVGSTYLEASFSHLDAFTCSPVHTWLPRAYLGISKDVPFGGLEHIFSYLRDWNQTALGFKA